MEENEGKHPKFPAFPYKPYSIQVDFMNALYHSLDQGGVSMLESPTGTGKTLSIICSALQWLVDQRRQRKSETVSESNLNQPNSDLCGSDDEPDWMKSFTVSKDIRGQENKAKDKIAVPSVKYNRMEAPENYRELFSKGLQEDGVRSEKKINNLQIKGDSEELSDEAFLLDEYESEEDEVICCRKPKRKVGALSCSSSSDEDQDADTYDEEKLKIYFCSRTHSQLSQFVKEMRKAAFADEVIAVCLGSRKNFCINEDVSRLGNATRINERCLELQKSKKIAAPKVKNPGIEGGMRQSKGSSGCPLLRKRKLQKQFRIEVSDKGPLDIEDLVDLGRSIGTCPYYGSRNMLPVADLVVLPYQSLLSRSSRESLALNLKDNIVIIDEAHNLADSLISMYDAMISLNQLERIYIYLEKYFQRFRNLLGPGNRRYIQTLLVVTRAFLESIRGQKDAWNANSCQDSKDDAADARSCLSSSMAINEFLFSLNIDNINLFKLLQYIKESNIIHKVSGYGDKVGSSQKGLDLNNGRDLSDEGSTLSSFRALVDMLLSLTNSDGEGRILVSRTRQTCSGQQGGYLKYIMLTGEKIFSEIVEQAHAIILAGGTLQPIEETKERLFPWLPPSRFHFFSCNHIVPPENILPIAVSQGPSGHSFDFSYNSRSSAVMIQELGLLLCNLATVVPEGIVVFFSSFDYEGQVYDSWKTSGIVERLLRKKRVFREPRRNTDVESVLKEYKKEIDSLSSMDGTQIAASRSGAILLAVVGGKISEGINFSDGMGRCIVMVGLPYPSPSDIELIERVKHIEGLGNQNSIKATVQSASDEHFNGKVQTGFDILRSCRNRGKEYYDNLCIKAVNQSIGRAIRHINDYAAILLVDTRYSFDSTKRGFSQPTKKLPQWIKSRLLSATDNYGEVHKQLRQFFKFHRRMTLQ